MILLSMAIISTEILKKDQSPQGDVPSIEGIQNSVIASKQTPDGLVSVESLSIQPECIFLQQQGPAEEEEEEEWMIQHLDNHSAYGQSPLLCRLDEVLHSI